MLKNLKISFIISSLAYIVLGAVLLIWPTTSLKVICYSFGGITLFYGLIRFTSYLSNRENPSVLQGDLFFGIIMMGIGIFLLIKPDIILSILPIVLGLFIIFNSVIKLQYGFELKSSYYDKWWILLFLGLFTAVLGTVIALNPFKAMETTVKIIGSVLVADGLSNIFTILFVTIVLHQLKRAAADLALAGTGADSVVDNTDPEVTETKIIIDAEETKNTNIAEEGQTPIETASIETQPIMSDILSSAEVMNTEKAMEKENLKQ